MKRNNRVAAVFLLLSYSLLLVLQIVFLTLKLSEAASLSWRMTLSPIFYMIWIPIAFVVTAVLVLLPKAVADSVKRRKRIEAEAKKHGLVRKPGESDVELSKRIVRRNMIEADCTRKGIKDAILEAFPNVGSCQIFVDYYEFKIEILLRGVKAEIGTPYFSDDELQEVAEFAAKYVPKRYKVTVKNA